MEVSNTVAYYDTSTITTVKSLIVQAPGKFVPDKPFELGLMLASKATARKDLPRTTLWLILLPRTNILSYFAH